MKTLRASLPLLPRFRVAVLFAGVWLVATAAPAQNSKDLELEKIEIAYRFENDGAGQVKIHIRWKALTSAGAKELSQVSVQYLSEYETVQVQYFKTIKKTGESLDGDGKQIFDTTPASQSSEPEFSGTKLKQFVPPNVESGDTVEYELSKFTKP